MTLYYSDPIELANAIFNHRTSADDFWTPSRAEKKLASAFLALKEQMENDKKYQIEICHDCTFKTEQRVREKT